MARTRRNTAWSVKRMRRGNISSVVRQEMKDFLVIGKQYLIHSDGERKRMELVGIYPNIATFEKDGTKESFSYPELYQMFKEVYAI